MRLVLWICSEWWQKCDAVAPTVLHGYVILFLCQLNLMKIARLSPSSSKSDHLKFRQYHVFVYTFQLPVMLHTITTMYMHGNTDGCQYAIVMVDLCVLALIFFIAIVFPECVMFFDSDWEGW